MDQFDHTTSTPAGRGSNTYLPFLSLYLLVLAFFILLVSISTLEDVKSRAAMKSLTAVFSTVLPSTDETSTSEQAGFQSGQVFQEEITGIFATSLQVAKVEVVQKGRSMRVLVPAEALFESGTPKLKEALSPLLDRLVATLGRRPPGVHHDIEFVIGSAVASTDALPTGETLEVARAGAFAREMLSRGAPPDGIAAGLRAGAPEDVALWFFARSRDELRIDYSAAGAATGPAGEQGTEPANR